MGPDGLPLRVRTPHQGEILGKVTELFGGSRMNVVCQDGFTRMCRIPGKIRRKLLINPGDIEKNIDALIQDVREQAQQEIANDWLSAQRAALGAAQNRLSYAAASLTTTSQNVTAANSQIRDVDVASETSNMSKEQILMQAGVSVLAQANQVPHLALKLLSSFQ